jgi:nicotinate-nucleotide adenylyltransferase
LDAFAEIGTWKDFEKIFPLCNFIVTSRPGNGYASPLRGTSIAVRRLFCYDFKRKIYTHRCGTSLHFLKLTDFAVSASDIRERVRHGKSIRYLVPSSVEAYVKNHGLYKRKK